MNLTLEPLNETLSKQMHKNPGQCLAEERDFFNFDNATNKNNPFYNTILQLLNYRLVQCDAIFTHSIFTLLALGESMPILVLLNVL